MTQSELKSANLKGTDTLALTGQAQLTTAYSHDKLKGQALQERFCGLSESYSHLNYTTLCIASNFSLSCFSSNTLLCTVHTYSNLLVNACMTTARHQQICLEATAYYHCISRCVRRAFLCGLDEESGVSYEHRRSWVEDRLFALAKVFCIDLCAYAIMSNHYHLVLHINKAKADSLSDNNVIDRWLTFHNPPVLIQRYLRGDICTQTEYSAVSSIIQGWRQRLYSISWFMRLLNQFIATEANKEDGCSGHFWEGRFKSQALLDDKALAAAMAYVDLNPVRAGIAKTPETSDFTSIKYRLNNLRKPKASVTYLYPFMSQSSDRLEGIPLHLADYLEFLDWIGRHFHEGKTGQIAHDTPPILKRLGLNSLSWFRKYKQFEKGCMIGTKSSMKACLPLMGRKRISGIQLSMN